MHSSTPSAQYSIVGVLFGKHNPWTIAENEKDKQSWLGCCRHKLIDNQIDDSIRNDTGTSRKRQRSAAVEHPNYNLCMTRLILPLRIFPTTDGFIGVLRPLPLYNSRNPDSNGRWSQSKRENKSTPADPLSSLGNQPVDPRRRPDCLPYITQQMNHEQGFCSKHGNSR